MNEEQSENVLSYMKPHIPLTENDINLALLPIIRKLCIKEIDIDSNKAMFRSFINLDEAIAYMFDMTLRHHIPVPIGYERNHYLLEMTFITSSSMEGRVDTHCKIAEMLYENWCHEYDPYTGKRIEREPLTINRG